MKRILLGTIGAGSLSETTYRFPNGQSHTTSYCTHAIAETVEPDETYVFLTKKANESHGEMLSVFFGDRKLVKKDIPDGANEKELWQIFGIITESIGEIKDEIELYVDITHAYRSLPLLLVIATAYLRQAQGVNIREIFYGAYEARANGVTPVFTLLPFVTLFDWVNGVEAFSRTGDSSILARLLRYTDALAEQTVTPASEGNTSNKYADSLKAVATVLERLTLDLDLIRIDRILLEAANLQRELKALEQNLPREAHPFRLLLQRIQTTYGQFALASPRTRMDENLKRQLNLINWFVKHGRVVAATLLAREWFLSWHMLKTGHTAQQIYHYPTRDDFAKTLEKHLRREEKTLWTRLKKVRNDVGHVSLDNRVRSAQELMNDISEIVARLRTLLTEKQS